MNSEFELLNLKENLLKGIFTHGFNKPSHIQKKVIPALAQGESAVVQAKNGAGKTAMFLLGVLQRINERDTEKKSVDVQAIILSPTRELSLQTFSVLNSLSKYLNIKTHCAVGGHRTLVDADALSEGVDVLCGTPGRILQLLRESSRFFSSLITVIFDEADRILDKGFGAQVKSILDLVGRGDTQLVFVSATLPEEVTDALTSLRGESSRLFLLSEGNPRLTQISQYYAEVTPDTRFESLCEVLSIISVSQAVIFVNRKEDAACLDKTMRAHGFSVTSLHSSLEQKERDKRINEFFSGKHRILVSTDIASRGIDAAHVNLVVNYHMPSSSEEYLHRIGRGGRFGKVSTAVTFVLNPETEKIQSICGAAIKSFF